MDTKSNSVIDINEVTGVIIVTKTTTDAVITYLVTEGMVKVTFTEPRVSSAHGVIVSSLTLCGTVTIIVYAYDDGWRTLTVPTSSVMHLLVGIDI